MKLRKVVTAAMVLAFLTMTGCVYSVMEYMDRTSKPNINGWTESRYDSQNYTVLGTVEVEVQSRCILAVYLEGRDGQGELMREAKNKFPNATGIKDVSAVKDYEAILPPLLMKVRTTYFGTVVAEK